MPYINVDGARIWYGDTGGPGPALVFLHPSAGCSESWVHQIPAFEQRHYRCITFDTRGWGRSPQPAHLPTGLFLKDIDVLIGELELDEFVLLGAAYGALGAVEYAARGHRGLRGLVASTTQCPLTDPAYVAAAERVGTAALQALPIEMRELGPSYRFENAEGVERWLQVLRRGRPEASPRTPTYRSLTSGLLRSIELPTLFIAGDADLLAPPALMRMFVELITDSQLAVIPEAGHSAHWERPDEWNACVFDFLGSL